MPCSRRNAPLVYDANPLLVLFGGDHEDYQLNDTYVDGTTTSCTALHKPAMHISLHPARAD